jgi:hypothetical protein
MQVRSTCRSIHVAPEASAMNSEGSLRMATCFLWGRVAGRRQAGAQARFPGDRCGHECNHALIRISGAQASLDEGLFAGGFYAQPGF